LKNNYIFVLLVFLLLIAEIFEFKNTGDGTMSLPEFIFRELVNVALAILYYRQQGSKLNMVQIKFLTTILIPLLLGLSRFTFTTLIAIKLNTFLYLVIYALWLNILKSLGTQINKFRFPRTYYLLVPIIFIIPFLNYFLVILPMEDIQIKISFFLFTFFAAFTCVFVMFLPPSKNIYDRYLIIFGIWLTEFIHIMQSYYVFNSEIFFIYPFVRILQSVSYMSLIFGMTSYYKQHSRIIKEN
jgi:hypothetical protein